MVAVDCESAAQSTHLQTHAAPANSSRVENVVAERLAVAWLLLGRRQMWRDLLAWEAVVFWVGKALMTASAD